MKFRFFRIESLGLLAGLALAVSLVGCGETATPPVPLNTNVHSQLKDNLRSSFAGLVKESKSTRATALMSSFSNIQNMLGINISSSLPANLDIDFITRIVQDIFESELANEIFSDANIVSQSSTEIAYSVRTAACAKLSMLMGGEDEAFTSACTTFLEKNMLEFHVKSLPDNGMELELWHAKREAGNTLQLVVALNMSPTSLGLRLNFDGAKEFVENLMTLGANAPGLASLGVKKLSGAITLLLRFQSGQLPSGCKNKEGMCVIANVDRNLDVQLDDLFGEALSLQFQKSLPENPTVTVSAKDDNSFFAAFNLGALDGRYGMNHVFLETSQFKFTLPPMVEGLGFQFMLEDFKAGPMPSMLDLFGTKIVIDLASEQRKIDRVDFSMNANQALIDLSPASLIISLSDDSDQSCVSHESLKFTTDATMTTKLQMLFPPSTFSNLHTRYSNKSARCDESNLLAFMIWSMLSVSSENCNLPGALLVQEGSVELNYSFYFNDDKEQTSMLAATSGQCLRI